MRELFYYLFTMKFFCILFRVNFSKKLYFLRFDVRELGGI